jgi:hypothetical protein
LNAAYRKKVWFNKNTDSKRPLMLTEKTQTSMVNTKRPQAKETPFAAKGCQHQQNLTEAIKC